MARLLEVNAGLIRLKDTASRIIFDSNEKLFQAVSYHTGAQVCGSWTASYNANNGAIFDVDTDIVHFLAPINSVCDTAVGAFSVSTSSPGYGVQGLGWFNASGSYVHYFDAPSATTKNLCQQFCAFSFECDSGWLRLRERVVLRALVGIGVPSNSITVNEITFDYKIYVGSFV